MKKSTTKKTILFGSIILITGIIASQAFAYMGGGYNMGNQYGMMGGSQMGYGNHMGSGMNGNNHMMQNLSAEDQKKMQDQMNTFFSSTRQIREQTYQKQLDLKQEYLKSDKDQGKIEALQKELFDLSARFEKERFSHMQTMQKLFSDKGNGNFMAMGGGYGDCF